MITLSLITTITFIAAAIAVGIILVVTVTVLAQRAMKRRRARRDSETFNQGLARLLKDDGKRRLCF